MHLSIGKETTMALDLLRRIAGSPLPMSFTRTADIERVRILRAAGLVVAFVPAAHHPSIAMLLQRPAQVVGITQKGRDELLLHDGALSS
ncbi:hypothetical protein ACQ858_15555 [Variovorax ureilyticus]|uniref:hypothetical protein n=1 Tax=Variovorax ureilyticus TaxID=1836198 RepID=UPI003D6739A5